MKAPGPRKLLGELSEYFFLVYIFLELLRNVFGPHEFGPNPEI